MIKKNKSILKVIFLLFILINIFVGTAFSRSIVVKMYKVAAKGHGKSIGQVTLMDSSYGMIITPQLHNLPPGLHGFHVHEKPSCANYGKAAGGHLDPTHSGKHLGPNNPEGHLGDLPVLKVREDGTATTQLLAPKLKTAEVVNHSLMIHAKGDNYSDSPKPLGGGGARIACGIVK